MKASARPLGPPLIAVLLLAAAIGSVGRAADASIVGRIGGVFAALALVLIAINTFRRERWAFGAAFLVALCWFWAAIALRVQGVISGAEALIWLAWSITVMVATVRGREPEPPGPRFPPMNPEVGEDISDG